MKKCPSCGYEGEEDSCPNCNELMEEICEMCNEAGSNCTCGTEEEEENTEA